MRRARLGRHVPAEHRRRDGPGRRRYSSRSSQGSAGLPRVVHGPSGRVLVTWTDQVASKILLRVSTNGGASFGATITLGKTASHPLRERALFEAYPTLAAGKGVMYVTYFSGPRDAQGPQVVRRRQALEHGT